MSNFIFFSYKKKKSSLLILPKIAATTLSNERLHYGYMYVVDLWTTEDTANE